MKERKLYDEFGEGRLAADLMRQGAVISVQEQSAQQWRWRLRI